MNRKPLLATQSGLSGAGVTDVSVGIKAVITDGLAVVYHRPVQVTVSGSESVRNLGWCVGMTLANEERRIDENRAVSVASNRDAANALRKLADEIEHGPRDNLGANIRTELFDNLAAKGIALDSIWQIP